ncbi:MAG: tyrosine-type recombinase/integrase [Candidatus Woesearchaeota archaeon]|jgi:integrase
MMGDTQRQNIYGESRLRMDNEKRRLVIEEISDKNKKIITTYINFLHCNSASAQRCNKISCNLRLVCRLLNKDLDTVTKDDIAEVMMKIRAIEDRSESTKQDYLLAIKQFYKWYEGEDERIYSMDEKERRTVMNLYRHIRTTRLKYRGKKVNPSDIITDEDVKSILTYCRNYREKVFIRLLHEMGARAGEFLNIKIKHITFEEDGCAKIHLDGKTGERRVPIVYSVPYLRQYLEIHPFKNNPDSFLWWTERESYKNHPLKYGGANKMLNEIWRKMPDDALVKRKKHNMHFFRHSRASILAPRLTEVMLCKYLGWTIGSDQVKTYVHLSPDDLDKVYFSNLGLVPKEVEKEKAKPKICSMCGLMNDSIADYCIRCAKPMTVDVGLRTELMKKHQLEITFDKMQEMMKNPEFVAFVERMNAKV